MVEIKANNFTSIYSLFKDFVSVLRQESRYVAQAGLKLWSSSVSFLSAGILLILEE
jgi:hypothetical protein